MHALITGFSMHGSHVEQPAEGKQLQPGWGSAPTMAAMHAHTWMMTDASAKPTKTTPINTKKRLRSLTVSITCTLTRNRIRSGAQLNQLLFRNVWSSQEHGVSAFG